MPTKSINKIKTISSPKGHEIAFYELKIDEKLPNIFFLGVFHGNETEGEYAICQFMEELQRKLPDDCLYNLYFLPCLNPDGKELKTRFNLNKVDLNRNYPTANFKTETKTLVYEKVKCGAPASEVETQFMMQLVEKYSPAIIISTHSDLHLIDYDGPARDLALMFSDKTGYKFVESVGYETPGSFGTWAGIERKIPLITVETWGGTNLEEKQKIWQELRPAFYEVLRFKITNDKT